MPTLPAGFDAVVDELLATIDSVEGQLREREIRLLALAAACPSAEGRILEIGSFKGKSTIVLSKGAALAGDPQVFAVDPMTAPAATDPSLGADTSSRADFDKNLERAGVAQHVKLFQMYSTQLAESWNDPLRLLWIDGDHTYGGTKFDFDAFTPFLVDRGILVMDDVIRLYEGPSRVFCENVLLSKNFGACGIVGKLGWAQYLEDPADAQRYEDDKLALYRRLSRLIPYTARTEKPTGLRKLRFKLRRHRVPHASVDPQRWLAKLL